MLNRYQVLLPDWLEDYIRYVSETYDFSFSEVIRGEICCSILSTISLIYPNYKPDITIEEIFGLLKEQGGKNMERNDMHRILSKLYFETRKAVEYRLDKEKKPKKK